MDASTRELVRRRALDRCEYCHIPQDATPVIPFHVEHVIAKQHGGGNDPDQLALACDRCNAYKGPNIASVDPETGAVVPLYHPRHDAWDDHFAFHGGTIVGLTPTGRSTVRLLNMHARRRVDLRREWLGEAGR